MLLLYFNHIKQFIANITIITVAFLRVSWQTDRLSVLYERPSSKYNQTVDVCHIRAGQHMAYFLSNNGILETFEMTKYYYVACNDPNLNDFYVEITIIFFYDLLYAVFTNITFVKFHKHDVYCKSKVINYSIFNPMLLIIHKYSEYLYYNI